MITEQAILTIDIETATEFERAISEAEAILQRATGYLGSDLTRCIEDPAVYRLQVRWLTLEDHTVHFREDGLDEWRGIVVPFVVGSDVRHFAPVGTSDAG